jgi:iron complex outermembrane receptor protein
VQRRDQLTQTVTNAIFAGDSWRVTPNLTVDYGVKQIWVNREIENYLPYALSPNGSINDTATLPQVGFSYRPNELNQIFGTVGTSFRSAPNFTQTTSYNAGTGALSAPVVQVDPERGIQFELGHRFQGPLFATSISAFNGWFENFQQSTNIADPTGGNAPFNVTRNIGRVVNYGIQAEFGTRPIYNFRPYIGAQLMRAELRDNLPVVVGTTADAIRTAGKELPATPNFSAGIGLDYDDGTWFGNLGLKYTGMQYSTLLNDQSIPAFWRTDAVFGYRFRDYSYLKAPAVKLNVFNLLDEKDLVGVNGTQNNALATTTVGGLAFAGANPTYFVGQGRSYLLTFSTGF